MISCINKHLQGNNRFCSKADLLSPAELPNFPERSKMVEHLCLLGISGEESKAD